MLAPWAVEEMKAVDLADERLNKRVASILSALASGRQRASPQLAAVTRKLSPPIDSSTMTK